MAKLLNAAQILAAKVPFEDVPCPELGGTVRIQALSAAAREKLQAVLGGGTNVSSVQIVAASAVNEKGDLLFSIDESEKLLRVHGVVIERLAGVAFKINSLTVDEAEELEGNPAGASSSGSA